MNSQLYNSSGFNKFPSVLIVEPDEAQRKGLAIALMDHFSVVKLTDNPLDAFRIIKNNHPSLIITEINFGVSNFVEVLKNFKSASPDTFLFIVSSFLNDKNREELSELQVDSIFEKPLDINSILIAIKSLGIKK